MNDIDKKTLELIEERYGITNVVNKFIDYVQESNKELVELKMAVKDFTGKDPAPRNSNQLQKLREGGDILKGIKKLLDLNKRMKVK